MLRIIALVLLLTGCYETELTWDVPLSDISGKPILSHNTLCHIEVTTTTDPFLVQNFYRACLDQSYAYTAFNGYLVAYRVRAKLPDSDWSEFSPYVVSYRE